jgi:plastocyanin
MNTMKRVTRRGGLLLAAALAVTLSANLSPARAADGPQAAKVTIDNFAFTPASLTIKQGTRVTFVNHDDIPHSIVNASGKFRSKALDTDQSFEFTFATAGDFDYFCGLHPHMKGKIIVTPE